MVASALAPAIAAPLVVFMLYRRVRRNIGRQPVNERRMLLRIAILLLAAAMIFAPALHDASLAAGAAAGLIAGGSLAWLGVRLTRFETTAAGHFYVPNLYLGLAITAVLLARVAYRFTQLYPLMQAQTSAPPPMVWAGTPLTIGLFGLVIGYYLAYVAGVLYVSRHQRAAALSL